MRAHTHSVRAVPPDLGSSAAATDVLVEAPHVTDI